MSTALLKTQEAPSPELSKREQLVKVARAGLRTLVGVVPSLVGAGLWGAVKGAVIFGSVGALVAVGYWVLPRWMGSAPTPLWLDILSGVLPPVALSLAGCYALMLQAVTSKLAQQTQERGLMGYLYAIIKPVAVQAARRLRGSGTLSRAELTRVIDASLAERLREAASASDAEPDSRSEKLERFLMEHSRRVLGLVALRTALSAPDVPGAVKNLETLGIDRLEQALAETLEDLFFFQMVLSLGAGVLVAAIPPLLMWLLH
jgi:type II secretory pathway component PulM